MLATHSSIERKGRKVGGFGTEQGGEGGRDRESEWEQKQDGES